MNNRTGVETMDFINSMATICADNGQKDLAKEIGAITMGFNGKVRGFVKGSAFTNAQVQQAEQAAVTQAERIVAGATKSLPSSLVGSLRALLQQAHNAAHDLPQFTATQPQQPTVQQPQQPQPINQQTHAPAAIDKDKADAANYVNRTIEMLKDSNFLVENSGIFHKGQSSLVKIMKEVIENHKHEENPIVIRKALQEVYRIESQKKILGQDFYGPKAKEFMSKAMGKTLLDYHQKYTQETGQMNQADRRPK